MICLLKPDGKISIPQLLGSINFVILLVPNGHWHFLHFRLVSGIGICFLNVRHSIMIKSSLQGTQVEMAPVRASRKSLAAADDNFPGPDKNMFMFEHVVETPASFSGFLAAYSWIIISYRLVV